MNKTEFFRLRSLAEALVRQNKTSEAVPILEEIQSKYPEDAWAYQKNAYINLRINKKYHEAVNILQKAIINCENANLNDIETLNRLHLDALSHIKGEEKRADELFKSSISKKDGTNKIKLLRAYADFCARQKKFKEAQQIYQSILKYKCDDIRTVIDLARSYRLSEDYDKCLEILDKYDINDEPFALLEIVQCLVAKAEPEKIPHYIKLIKDLLNNEQWKKHKFSFTKKIEIIEKAYKAITGDWKETFEWITDDNKVDNIILHSTIKTITASKKINESIEYLINKYNANLISLSIPYIIYYALQKCDTISDTEKLNILLDLFNRNIKNFCSCVAYAKFKSEVSGVINNDEWIKCKTLLDDKSITINKYFIIWFYTLYSQYLRKSGAYEEAFTAIEEVNSRWDANNFDLDIERAIVLGKLGNYQEAYEILSDLNSLKPDNYVILDQMGICLRGTGRLDEAYAVYERKQKLNPDTQGKIGLAKTLFDMGRHEEALKHLFDILEVNNKDVEAKFFIAEIYRGKGNFEKAEEFLKDIDKADVLSRGLNSLLLERKLSELQREKLEQLAELEDAKKLSYLGTMATATAHELNQPIGIIRSATDAALLDIRDGLFGIDETKKVLELIWYQSERLSKIIENFRNFSRGDRSTREMVDINELIRRTVSTFEEQFKHRNISIKIQLHHGNQTPYAWANPYQLEEVIINLLTNARDAVDGNIKQPTIWIKSYRRRGGITGFSIEDNGPGLSEDYRRKIFVPFVSTKSTEKGTGLGLYISRKIVENTGGRLRYRDRDGGGAFFYAEFPPIGG